MCRHTIGIIAILLLLGAVLLWISPQPGAWGESLKAACWRLGPCMVVLWLAYPEVARLPGWIWAVIPLLLAILAWRPKLFLVFAPIVIALAIVRPKLPRRK